MFRDSGRSISSEVIRASGCSSSASHPPIPDSQKATGDDFTGLVLTPLSRIASCCAFPTWATGMIDHMKIKLVRDADLIDLEAIISLLIWPSR